MAWWVNLLENQSNYTTEHLCTCFHRPIGQPDRVFVVLVLHFPSNTSFSIRQSMIWFWSLVNFYLARCSTENTKIVAPPICQNLYYNRKSSFCGTFVKTFLKYKCSTRNHISIEFIRKTFWNVFWVIFMDLFLVEHL